MMKSDQGGYSSVAVLALVLFLSAAALGILAYSRIAGLQYGRMENTYKKQQDLETAVHDLIAQLKKDPTPEADSPGDPVWDWIAQRDEGEPVLKLEDISSRFNLNFVRTKMLDESDFGAMMINGKTPEGLKQYRGEKGLASDLHEGYGDFFKEKDLDRYFTIFSWANLNVTYEDSLKKLYEIRVSDEGSHVFLSSVQALIANKEMADENRMKQILGGDEKKLFPVINIEPLMNVNFVDEKILKAVLFYPYGGKRHEKAADFLDIISAERTTMEITPDRLKELLDVEGDYLRMLQYLGTRTWFWKITAMEGGTKLTAVICRLPAEDKGDASFKIVQWKFNS